MKMCDAQKRVFDILASLILLGILILPMIIIGLLVRGASEGPAIFWSIRVGKKSTPFWMPKFRTMKKEAPLVPTNQLENPTSYLAPLGSFLRKSSLDELPQIFCILIGHMSFVGPRPALLTQNDLLAKRIEFGIDRLRPGLTGWAQINGRDDISDDVKTQYDLEYLNQQSILFDMKILLLTFLKVITREGVKH